MSDKGVPGGIDPETGHVIPRNVTVCDNGAWWDRANNCWARKPKVHTPKATTVTALEQMAACKERFLAALGVEGSVPSLWKAAKAAQVTMRVVDLWRADDEGFNYSVEAILEEYYDGVEERLDDRSQNEKGMPGVTATAMILNAGRRKKYVGSGGGGDDRDMNITVTLRPQPLPEWDKPKLEAGKSANDG